MTVTTAGAWVVDVKGKPDGDTWEIAVIRESDSFGLQSWGWFSKDKLLVSHSGGPWNWPLAPGLGSVMVQIAKDYAAKLNAEEK